jgi:hypothetical protein
MKLLILTDFSENSVNAYRYGVKMACHLNAELLLLFSTNGAAMSLTLQLQYSQQLNSFATRYACDARQHANHQYPDTLLSSDSWQDLLPAMVAVHQPDLILAGSELLQQIGPGSEACALDRLGGCPVLWLPEKAVYQPLQHLVLVTDFSDQDPAVAVQVKDLAGKFGGQVALVHFYPAADRGRLAGISKQGAALQACLGQPDAPYYLLEEEDMMEGLQDYADRHPADLFLFATRDTHLAHQYLQAVYRKTQACQVHIPLLNLFQDKKKPCAGSCAFCRIKEKESRPQAPVME